MIFSVSQTYSHYLNETAKIIPGGDILLACSKIKVVWRHFYSARREIISFDQSDNFCQLPDGQIKENNIFQYPVFRHSAASKGVILLLHGLNERAWGKYYPWALRLAEETGKDVILFPISFHMNRSPLSWSDRRKMMEKVLGRKRKYSQLESSTFANIALSERLTYYPERFLFSGYQSANDILHLVENIQSGNDKYWPAKTSVDFFGYSIGAFLSQILFMANPKGILSKSRLFLFCGGSVFNYMNGVSKYIMDNVAFKRLLNRYGDELENDLRASSNIGKILSGTALGSTFFAMTNLKRLSAFGSNIIAGLKDRIQSVGLLKDSVITKEGIEATLKESKTRFINPQYPYTHENPFPIVKGESAGEIDRAFNEVMGQAALFLS